MKTFIRHEACPKCGSKNNVSVYYNDVLRGETYYCHTPGCNYAKTDRDLCDDLGVSYESSYQETDVTVIPGNYIVPDVVFGDFRRRKLSRSVCEKYRIGINSKGLPVFPYYRVEVGLVAAKIATGKDEPRFYWEGEDRAVRLFGMQFIPDTKNLIITEGEFDAVAAHVMTGYTAWSIPGGAKSAKKFIRLSLREIEQFERVYICFDNDQDGQRAAHEATALLRASVARRVELPVFTMSSGKTAKDACDFRIAGRDEDFRDAIESAVKKSINTIYSSDQLKSEIHSKVFDKNSRIGEPTGIRKLDEYLGGWRKKELTVIWGDVSEGKSSISRLLLVKQLMTGHKCFYLPLEDGADSGFTKIMEMVHQVRIISRPEEELQLTEEQVDAWIDELTNKLYVSDFESEVDWQELAESIEYAVRIYGCEYVLLDHITIACADDRRENTFSKLSSTVKKLRELAKNLGIHIWVVSHISKDATGEYKGFGSSAIRQIADNVLQINRDKGSNTVTLSLLKNRLWGKIGNLQLIYDWLHVEFREVGDGEEVHGKKQRHRGDFHTGLGAGIEGDAEQLWLVSDTQQSISSGMENSNSHRIQSRFLAAQRGLRGSQRMESNSGGVVTDAHPSRRTTARGKTEAVRPFTEELYIAPSKEQTDR